MKEHIIVLDEPPQFGKGIPDFYNIQVFDVPDGSKKTVIKELESLGFSGIREEIRIKGNWFRRKDISLKEQPCILAKYFTVGERSEYELFWSKKEKIEIAIDNLLVKLVNTY